MEEEDITLMTSGEVISHKTEEDAWVIHKGSIFNVTEFLSKHPGGKEIILQHAGQDVTEFMMDNDFHQHSISAYSLLQTYKIGNVKDSSSLQERNRLKMNGWNEGSVNWDEGMVKQVYKFGSHYKTWVTSPVDKKLRLFDSDFVEFFSKTPWYVVPILWIPVVIIMAYISIQNLRQYSVPDFERLTIIAPYIILPIIFCFGIFLWTLAEYILHRCLFHFNPDESPFWITIHFVLHGHHHKVPFDHDRLVFPPVAAAVFAAGFYVMLINLMPLAFAQGLFSGGLFGYVIYDMTHYYLHHGHPIKGTYFDRLKQYHVAHHFQDHDKGFGISSKLWDFPFGTYIKKYD